MAQTRSLSDNQIFQYIGDIENKICNLPHREYQMPIYVGGKVPIEGLNIEATRMLEHIGLTMFTPKCIWADLPTNTAGDIQLDGSRSGDILIRITDRIKYNGKAAIAVLAHEICHKLLEYHGLYYRSMSELNEIYTDLCTIYVGFSQLILNGYKTTEGDKCRMLGYLEYNNYEHAERIIRLMSGDLQSSFIINDINSTDEEKSFAMWLQDRGKRAKHIEAFKLASEKFAEINRSLAILKEIIKHIPDAYIESLDKIEISYFDDDPFYGNNVSRPINAYMLSKPETYFSYIRTNTDNIERLNRLLGKIILAISNVINDNAPEVMIAKHFFCPFCGRQSDYNEINVDKVLRCPSCRKVFYLKQPLMNLPQKQENTVPHKSRFKHFWSKILKKN